MNIIDYQNMLALAGCGSIALQSVKETHGSWVILTPHYAFKIKKPVNYGFLNFSTLEKRKTACLEELRLNQKNVKNIYIRVCPIYETAGKPSLEPSEKIIEYALLMNRFEEKALLNHILDRRALTNNEIDSLADSICLAHEQANIATRHGLGRPETIHGFALDNFTICESLVGSHDKLSIVKNWTNKTYLQLKPLMEKRFQNGLVRECHGDLHFGNIVMQNDKPVLFDAIEFNPDYRWTDTMADLGFIIMDCFHRNLIGSASRLLNRYLEKTGDYEGVCLLPYFIAYRAMVRAKVALLTRESIKDPLQKKIAYQSFLNYLALAKRMSEPSSSILACMHGVSGSGKTTLSQALLDRYFLIRIRADVERKRLARQFPWLPMYGESMNTLTENYLWKLTSLLLQAKMKIIIDATFIQQTTRTHFQMLAKSLNSQFIILDCHLPTSLLFERVEKRLTLGQDASDATIAVVETQLRTEMPLSTQEKSYTLSFLLENQAALNQAIFEIGEKLYPK